ncbi:MAG TPA: bacillithiol biosynthesis cysteine-adding enzyme BshC [Bacillota bacterium]|nr:bacillithiol biosynthesis cysteine-adding enzyme BshC [Bacillota bacterium]
MKIKPLSLQQNKLMHHYRNQHADILEHFDYNPYKDDIYENRLKELNKRTFDRERLVEALMRMNEEWNVKKETYNNIARLKDENSVVVVGGQQAGLLTGPFYTIHKIISILQLAKQQEKSLHVPVIPVFWVAGEDHDFAEINHIFMPGTSSMEKYRLLQRISEKWSVSDIPVEDMYAKQWLNRIFGELKETQYTNTLYQVLIEHLEASRTYVDFFSRIIHALFQQEGIVLIDSHHPVMRQFERDFFIEMINQQKSISEGIRNEQRKLKEKGYELTLHVENNDGHLFYHHHKDRILLVKNESGKWIGKNEEVSFTTEELTDIAKETPELLSNNVVTRPLMQELVLPTLAFIGGPGEVNYWSMLKPVFHAMEIKMPPVVPRLSFTYLDTQVQKILSKYEINVQNAIENGTKQIKEEWLQAKNHPSVQTVSKQVKEAIEQAHRPSREIASHTRNDIRDLADKNLTYLKCDIEYLEKRIIHAMEEKYQQEINEFDLVDIHLYPMDGLQERVWNPIVWFNKYGTYFLNELIQQELSFSHDHYVVYL